LKTLSYYAGNRTELYEKLSKILDMPALNGAISLDYLKELIKKDSPYFKVERSQTRVLPIKNYRRCFDSKDILTNVEKFLL
jgi:hypothetical protein